MERFNSTLEIRVSGGNTAFSVADWYLRSGTCAFSNGSAIYACNNASASVPCGSLGARHGNIATLSLGSAPVLDSHLGLTGTFSVYGRAITLHDATGRLIDCANVEPWNNHIPTLTTMSGQTQCQNVTMCGAGQEEATPFTYSIDRTCRSCVADQTWKNNTGRFCAPVQTCGIGFQESIAATVSSDRVCAGVTCASLDPPAFGNITNCQGSGFVENFLATCTYSCDTSRAFRPINVTRTCQGDGNFDGVAPTCQCEGNLHLDSANGQCVQTCPDGFIASLQSSVSSCQQCAATCTDGFYESTPCDPISNTDRACSACRVCPAGTWATGGCFANNNSDTVCSPFSECPVGTYEVVAGTPTSDRQCGGCRACTNTTVSATFNTLYAAGGCCGTTDTICDGISSCPAGYFEKAAPALAAQGGYGFDRRCQKIRQCGVGEYIAAQPVLNLDIAVTDRVCSQCSQCSVGEYVVQNCTTTSNTVCAPHPACPAGQYRDGASAYSNGTCTTCATCASFEHEVSPCGVNGTDRTCALNTICDPVTAYEMTAPTTSTDRVCGACTICNSSEYVAEVCDTNSPGRCTTNSSESVCPRGTAVLTNLIGISYCVPCAACPSGTYARGGAFCPHTRVDLGFTDPRCFNVSICPTGFIETVAPTPTTDRVCQRCATCPPGTYEESSSGCVADTSALNCTVDLPCGSNQFELAPGTATRPRQCNMCRICGAGEYEVAPCSGSSDRVCRAHRQCASNEALLRPGTSMADAICRQCPDDVQGSDRPNNDPYLCPPRPFASQCPAPPPPLTPIPNSTYTQITFTLSGNYTAIVGLPTYTERIALFNNDLLAAVNLLIPDFDPSPITSLRSSPGSIVVTVIVADSDQANETVGHDVAAANLTSGLLSGFTFTYEGSALPLISLQQNVINPNSAAPTLSPTFSTAPSPATTSNAPTTASPVSTEAPVAAPTNNSNVGDADALSVAEEDDELSSGAIAGIVLACVFVLLNVIAVAYHRSRKPDPWKGSTNTVFNPAENDASEGGDDYLNMTAGADDDDTDENVFSSQVAKENRRLKEEIDSMGLKISEKNAIISTQQKSRKHAEHVLEIAVASKLKEENKVIQREIAAMKKELRKKREASKFQRAAALQAQLKAERAALEDEIVTADEVAQVALHAASDSGTLEDAIVDHDQSDMAEHERIAAEKARLSAEMARMTERLANM